MKAKIPRCPLLKDEKVIYCKNFPLRKMLPVEKIFESENLCLKDKHRSCPFFDKDKVSLESDLGICPFVAFEIISFCMAYPVKKIIANHVMTSPCNTDSYETCPVYKNVTGRHREERVANYKGFIVDESKRYLGNHMWVEKQDGTLRIGLDDFGQYVLGEVKNVVVRTKGEKVDMNDWLVKIEVCEGSFALLAPIKGEIVNVNDELKNLPTKINTDPYGSGWIGEIRTEETFYTISPEEAKRLLDEDILKLQNIIEENSRLNMPDGGEFVKDLRRKVQDKEKVRKIVKDLLNGEEV